MPRKIILDCDPGHDDAMAILLAQGNPAIELLAITTVAGNQTVDKTSLNARRVCSVAGIHVPIAAGCDRPLTRELKTAAYIHGESGLDGPALVERLDMAGRRYTSPIAIYEATLGLLRIRHTTIRAITDLLDDFITR